MLKLNTDCTEIWSMQKSLTKLWDLLITDIKPHEINVESDVYAPSRGPNIPDQRYIGMASVITKLMLPTEGTYTYVARSSGTIWVH